MLTFDLIIVTFNLITNQRRISVLVFFSSLTCENSFDRCEMD